MQRILTVYFSAGGRTAKAAAYLARALGADLQEIRPVQRYTRGDLNWMNPRSRSSVEMKDRSARPEIVTEGADPADYDLICLGFPIWWYRAPAPIRTYLETYEFAGKKILLFATSGSSGFGETAAELSAIAPGAAFVETEVLRGVLTENKLKRLVEICGNSD